MWSTSPVISLAIFVFLFSDQRQLQGNHQVENDELVSALPPYLEREDCWIQGLLCESKLVDNYLRTEEEEGREPSHPCQYGYRPGRITETVMRNLWESIQRVFDWEETVRYAFLDIQEVFDNTSQEVVKGLTNKNNRAWSGANSHKDRHNSWPTVSYSLNWSSLVGRPCSSLPGVCRRHGDFS